MRPQNRCGSECKAPKANYFALQINIIRLVAVAGDVQDDVLVLLHFLSFFYPIASGLFADLAQQVEQLTCNQ